MTVLLTSDLFVILDILQERILFHAASSYLILRLKKKSQNAQTANRFFCMILFDFI